MDWTYPRLTLVALLALTGLIYLPLRGAPFVYEDDWQLAAHASTSVPGRGLTIWTYRAIGLDAGRQHLANVAIHLGVGVTVYAVASALTSPLGAVLAAGIVLVHPINSEAVSYLSGRADLLVAWWSMLAIWLFLGWADHGGGAWRLLGTGLALAAAMWSKEIGLIAVLLLLLTGSRCRRAVPAWPILSAALWMGLGIVLGVTWHTLLTWQEGPLVGGTGLPWPMFAWLQLTAVWHLFALVVWPLGLSIDHDILGLGVEWRVGALVLTGSVLLLALWAWRRVPLLAWGLGWVAICLAPRFVWGTSEFLHEYHLYPAMVGVAIPLGAGLAWLTEPRAIGEAIGWLAAIIMAPFHCRPSRRIRL